MTPENTSSKKDKSLFQTLKEGMIKNETEIYDKIRTLVKDELLPQSYSMTDKRINLESSLEKMLEFVPENLTGAGIGFAKLVINTLLVFSFKRPLKYRLKKDIQEVKENIEKYENDLKKYKEATNFYKETLLKDDSLSPELKEQVEEGIQTLDELCYLYSNLKNTTENRLRSEQRFYNTLYPGKIQKERV